MHMLLFSVLLALASWFVPASEVEASSCLTRNNLTALPNGSLAPVICNQYGQLYGQYKDLITNNRNASNDYIDALIRQQQVGACAAGAPPTSSTSNV